METTGFVSPSEQVSSEVVNSTNSPNTAPRGSGPAVDIEAGERLGTGGRTTISPPPNVNSPDSFPPLLSSFPFSSFPFYPSSSCLVLASGIDTFNLSVNVYWRDKEFFDRLNDHKEEAQKRNRKVPIALPLEDPTKVLNFDMHPSGTNGYNWLLSSHDFALRVLDRYVPGQRPNIMVEIKSEALWRFGPINACEMILSSLRQAGADITEVKPSRLDICVDLIMPSELWRTELADHAVTRSRKSARHYIQKQLEGLSYGSGQQVMARLYDKVREISKSGKTWLFDVWGILEDIPPEYRIIRIEFQFRREVLKELGLIFLDDVIPSLDGLWAYATKNWLKFQDNPELHHTQQQTLPFWRIVQDGFLGVQDPSPLIRVKAVNADIEQLAAQAFGLTASMIALEMNDPESEHLTSLTPEESFNQINKRNVLSGKTADDLAISVAEKRARYLRAANPSEDPVSQN